MTPKWNQTDISNTVCGRKIKTSSIWTIIKIGIMISQLGSIFQNSGILSEKFFEWTKVIICPDFDIFTSVVQDTQFQSRWHSFEMMTSQNGAWFWRFWVKSFINEYLTWKFVLLLIFIFSSPLVHEMQVRALFDAVVS